MAERVKSLGNPEQGERCPQCCDGYLVFRKNRQDGHTFIGCSAYPGCRFTRNQVQRPPATRTYQRYSQYDPDPDMDDSAYGELGWLADSMWS